MNVCSSNAYRPVVCVVGLTNPRRLGLLSVDSAAYIGGDLYAMPIHAGEDANCRQRCRRLEHSWCHIGPRGGRCQYPLFAEKILANYLVKLQVKRRGIDRSFENIKIRIV